MPYKFNADKIQCLCTYTKDSNEVRVLIIGHWTWSNFPFDLSDSQKATIESNLRYPNRGHIAGAHANDGAGYRLNGMFVRGPGIPANAKVTNATVVDTGTHWSNKTKARYEWILTLDKDVTETHTGTLKTGSALLSFAPAVTIDGTEYPVDRFDSAGPIYGVDLASQGSGYGPKITVQGMNGNTSATATATVVDGKITALTPVNLGANYSGDRVKASIVSDTVSGDLSVVVSGSGEVQSISIANQKIAYSMKAIMLTSKRIEAGEALSITMPNVGTQNLGTALSIQDVHGDHIPPAICDGTDVYVHTGQNCRRYLAPAEASRLRDYGITSVRHVGDKGIMKVPKDTAYAGILGVVSAVSVRAAYAPRKEIKDVIRTTLSASVRHMADHTWGPYALFEKDKLKAALEKIREPTFLAAVKAGTWQKWKGTIRVRVNGGEIDLRINMRGRYSHKTELLAAGLSDWSWRHGQVFRMQRSMFELKDRARKSALTTASGTKVLSYLLHEDEAIPSVLDPRVEFHTTTLTTSGTDVTMAWSDGVPVDDTIPIFISSHTRDRDFCGGSDTIGLRVRGEYFYESNGKRLVYGHGAVDDLTLRGTADGTFDEIATWHLVPNLKYKVLEIYDTGLADFKPLFMEYRDISMPIEIKNENFTYFKVKVINGIGQNAYEYDSRVVSTSSEFVITRVGDTISVAVEESAWARLSDSTSVPPPASQTEDALWKVAPATNPYVTFENTNLFGIQNSDSANGTLLSRTGRVAFGTGCKFEGQAEASGDRVSTFLANVGDVGITRRVETAPSPWFRIAGTGGNNVLIDMKDFATLGTRTATVRFLEDVDVGATSCRTTSARVFHQNVQDVVLTLAPGQSAPASWPGTISCGKWEGTYVETVSATQVKYRATKTTASFLDTVVSSGEWVWTLADSTTVVIESAVATTSGATNRTMQSMGSSVQSSDYEIRAAAPVRIACSLADDDVTEGTVKKSIRVHLNHPGRYPARGFLEIGGVTIPYESVEEDASANTAAFDVPNALAFDSDVAQNSLVTVRNLQTKVSENIAWTLASASEASFDRGDDVTVEERFPYDAEESTLVCFANDTISLRGMVYEKNEERRIVLTPVTFKVRTISNFGENPTTGASTLAAARVHAVLEPATQTVSVLRFEKNNVTGAYRDTAMGVDSVNLTAADFAPSANLGWGSHDAKGVSVYNRVVPGMSAVTLGAKTPRHRLRLREDARWADNKYDGFFGDTYHYFANLVDGDSAVTELAQVESKFDRTIPSANNFWYDYLAKAALGHDVRETAALLGVSVEEMLAARPEAIGDAQAGTLRRDAQHGWTTSVKIDSQLDNIAGTDGDYTATVTSLTPGATQVLALDGVSLTMVDTPGGNRTVINRQLVFTDGTRKTFVVEEVDVNRVRVSGETKLPPKGCLTYGDMELNFAAVDRETLLISQSLIEESGAASIVGPFGNDVVASKVTGHDASIVFLSKATTVDTSKTYIKFVYFRILEASESSPVSIKLDHGDTVPINPMFTITDGGWKLLYSHMEATEGLAYTDSEYYNRVQVDSRKKYPEDGIYDVASKDHTACHSFVMASGHTDHTVTIRLNSASSTYANVSEWYGEGIYEVDGTEPSLDQLLVHAPEPDLLQTGSVVEVSSSSVHTESGLAEFRGNSSGSVETNFDGSVVATSNGSSVVVYEKNGSTWTQRGAVLSTAPKPVQAVTLDDVGNTVCACADDIFVWDWDGSAWTARTTLIFSQSGEKLSAQSSLVRNTNAVRVRVVDATAGLGFPIGPGVLTNSAAADFYDKFNIDSGARSWDVRVIRSGVLQTEKVNLTIANDGTLTSAFTFQDGDEMYHEYTPEHMQYNFVVPSRMLSASAIRVDAHSTFSASFWLNVPASFNPNDVLFNIQSPSNSLNFQTMDGYGQWRWNHHGYSSESGRPFSVGRFETDRWYFVAFTRDPSETKNQKLYVNGRLRATWSYAHTYFDLSNSNKTPIISMNNSKQASVYNRVLSAEEVSVMHAAGHDVDAGRNRIMYVIKRESGTTTFGPRNASENVAMPKTTHVVMSGDGNRVAALGTAVSVWEYNDASVWTQVGSNTIEGEMVSTLGVKETIESMDMAGDTIVVGSLGQKSNPRNLVGSAWASGSVTDPFGNAESSITSSIRRVSESLTMNQKYYSIAYFKTPSDGSTAGFRHATNDGLVFTNNVPATLDVDTWYMSVGVVHPPNTLNGDTSIVNRVVGNTGKIYKVSDGSVAASNQDLSLYPTRTTVQSIADEAAGAGPYNFDLGDVKNVYGFSVAPEWTTDATTTEYANDFTLEHSLDGVTYTAYTQGSLNAFGGSAGRAPSERTVIPLPSHMSARFVRLTPGQSKPLRVGGFVVSAVPVHLPIADSPVSFSQTTATIVKSGTETAVETNTVHLHFPFNDGAFNSNSVQEWSVQNSLGYYMYIYDGGAFSRSSRSNQLPTFDDGNYTKCTVIGSRNYISIHGHSSSKNGSPQEAFYGLDAMSVEGWFSVEDNDQVQSYNQLMRLEVKMELDGSTTYVGIRPKADGNIEVYIGSQKATVSHTAAGYNNGTDTVQPYSQKIGRWNHLGLSIENGTFRAFCNGNEISHGLSYTPSSSDKPMGLRIYGSRESSNGFLRLCNLTVHNTAIDLAQAYTSRLGSSTRNSTVYTRTYDLDALETVSGIQSVNGLAITKVESAAIAAGPWTAQASGVDLSSDYTFVNSFTAKYVKLHYNDNTSFPANLTFDSVTKTYSAATTYDLGAERNINMFQIAPDFVDVVGDYIKTFTVETSTDDLTYSTVGTTFNAFADSDPLFNDTSATKQSGRKVIDLGQTVTARYVRLNSQTHNGQPVMRAGAFGKSGAEENVTSMPVDVVVDTAVSPDHESTEVMDGVLGRQWNWPSNEPLGPQISGTDTAVLTFEGKPEASVTYLTVIDVNDTNNKMYVFFQSDDMEPFHRGQNPRRRDCCGRLLR